MNIQPKDCAAEMFYHYISGKSINILYISTSLKIIILQTYNELNLKHFKGIVLKVSTVNLADALIPFSFV